MSVTEAQKFFQKFNMITSKQINPPLHNKRKTNGQCDDTKIIM